MRDGGRVSLAVLNYMFKRKFVGPHSTLIISSPIALRKSIAASIQKFPDSVVKSFHQNSSLTVDVQGETTSLATSLRLAFFFKPNVHKRQTNLGI